MAFKSLTPAGYNYDNAQIPQYADIVPNFTLPADKVFYTLYSKAGWDYPLMRSKGVTHYERSINEEFEVGENGYSSAYPGRRFYDTPRLSEILGVTTSKTQSQMEAMADGWDISARVQIYETQEGAEYVPPDSIQWKWFLDRLISRFEAQKAIDGIPYYVSFNYFHFIGGIFALGQQSREKHRELYTTDVSSWPSITYVDSFGVSRTAVNDFSPGHNLSACNMVTSAIYIGPPDMSADLLMLTIMDIEVSKKQGKSSGVYIEVFHEWRPTFIESIVYPGVGVFNRKEKMRLSFSVHTFSSFIGMEYGNVSIDWSRQASQYQNTAKNPVGYYPPIHDGNDYFYAEGSSTTSPMPYYGSTGPGNYSFGLSDWSGFGVYYWWATQGQLASVTPQYLKYKIDAGPWINPSAAGSDVIDARFDKRGLCRGRVGLNSISFWYCNPYTDTTKKTLTIEHPVTGQLIVRTICGTTVHAEHLNLATP